MVSESLHHDQGNPYSTLWQISIGSMVCMCCVVFLGLKLKWFRAQLKLGDTPTNNVSSIPVQGVGFKLKSNPDDFQLYKVTSEFVPVSNQKQQKPAQQQNGIQNNPEYGTSMSPVTVKPVTVKPVTVKPVTVKPVTVKPVTVNPVAVKPVTVKQVTVKPVPVKPVIITPVTVKPVKVKPVTVTPVTAVPFTTTVDSVSKTSNNSTNEAQTTSSQTSNSNASSSNKKNGTNIPKTQSSTKENPKLQSAKTETKPQPILKKEDEKQSTDKQDKKSTVNFEQIPIEITNPSAQKYSDLINKPQTTKPEVNNDYEMIFQKVKEPNKKHTAEENKEYAKKQQPTSNGKQPMQVKNPLAAQNFTMPVENEDDWKIKIVDEKPKPMTKQEEKEEDDMKELYFTASNSNMYSSQAASIFFGSKQPVAQPRPRKFVEMEEDNISTESQTSA